MPRTVVTGLLAALMGLAGCGGEGASTPGAAGVSRPDSAEDVGALGVGTGIPIWRAGPAAPTLADFVETLAATRASRPWTPPGRAVDDAVSGLDYVQYRGIGFDESRAIWGRTAALPFEVHLFHPGGGNDVPVRIHLVEDGEARPLLFDRGRFRYGDEVADLEVDLPPEAGHAGFRVLFPLNDDARFDEVAAFLGASYFRLLGPDHVYGLSARGVAVNTADPAGEEFPDFTAFWLERPTAEADRLRFHALLDGPSITGAFHFVLIPGAGDRPTVLEVDARFFARRGIRTFGVAPLTSMYLHGTFDLGGQDDVRPRVHDSEGLLAHTGRGEWIWRPLTNRRGVRVTSLRDRDPMGFGLVQRTRDFESYLDLEARYDRRPSQWVQVDGGEWGSGAVRLVEIPSSSEFNDNIVAFWAPDGGLPAGESRAYRYRLITFDARLEGGELPGGPVEGERLARVRRTRVGWDALPGQANPPPRTRRRVVIDFAGGALDSLSAETEIEPVVSTTAGSIEGIRVETLPGGDRRVTFALELERDRPADLRVYLQTSSVLSETWSYLVEAPSER